MYDSLYAEYQRLFRALPGDRSGEEELRFEAFTERRTDHHGWGDHQRPHAVQYGGHTRRALPAALPPAPRDGNRYDR
ncbi:hypothetical protein HOY81_05060 [Streptomyces sp. JJ36]|nr:hypothetical protein [Streptomyces sp. JJ36]